MIRAHCILTSELAHAEARTEILAIYKQHANVAA